MTRSLARLSFRFLFTGIVLALWGVASPAGAQADVPGGVWQNLPASGAALRAAGESWIAPSAGSWHALDASALEAVLNRAPREFSAAARSAPVQIEIPMPDGSYARFQLEESPVMHPDLAARFPEIRTFVGQGIDDPQARGRFDWTPQGFHAQVLSEAGAVYVDPAFRNDTTTYVSYYKQDYRAPASKQWSCGVSNTAPLAARPSIPAPPPAPSDPVSLRRYRLAVAATGEYTQFHGGTVPGAMAAIVTTINRVTGIYENEVAVRLQLVANNNVLVYTNPATDPYSNDDGVAMLSQNAANLGALIGAANFDIGHVFSTGGGGIAGLGVVCQARKAEGVTGSESPVGDPFDIDFVAHEMGHQFGGNHTFNGDSGSCSGGNRNGPTAYEPGSGTTIQAYAGICGNDNLQPNSDPFFHSESIAEIGAYVRSGGGSSCPVTTVTANRQPSADAGPNFIIPARTPFALTASGSDIDGDPLTYSWEERDLGPQQDVSAGDNGSSPLFRFRPPTSSPTRTFPRLSDLLNNTSVVGEKLPTTSRTMTFRVTVRDNRAGGGGTAFDDMTLTVVDSGAPFAVTFPNTSLTLSGAQTVTWTVAGTTAAPISTPLVDILLSSDGGLTYPTVLANGVPNTGSASVVFPNLNTSTARVRVQGHGNVFFDISNANFTLQPSSGLVITPVGTQNATGLAGGPFLPSPISYTLTNAAGAPLAWSARPDVAWLSLSSTGGVIGAGGSVALNATFSPAAGTLVAGIYTGTVSITNLTLLSVQTREIRLEVLAAGGLLQFSPVSYSFSEAAGSATVLVQRTGSAVGAVTATVETISGTALAGADFVAKTGTVAWANGDTASKSFTVSLVNDAGIEPAESFALRLRSPAGGATLGSASNATVTLTDDDSNDACPGAFLVSATPFSNTQDTSDATSAGDPGTSCVGNFGNGVWYAFTAPTGGVLTVDTAGSSYDTVLGIYTGTCGALTEIGCDDDSGSGLLSYLRIGVSGGATYYLLAGGYNAAVGSLTFNLNFTPGTATSGCANAFLDSDFEAGFPWSDWDDQFSVFFDTPICDVPSCGSGPTFGPRSGLNWIDFYGPDDFLDDEIAAVGQTVLLPEGSTVELRFYLWIGEVAPPYTDELVVTVDGSIADVYPEPPLPEAGYTLRTVNLDGIADGLPHTIGFEFYSPALGGNSMFNVDDVELQVCVPEDDFDMDGLPNSVDPDDDNDGIPDDWEIANGLNPLFAGDALLDTDDDNVIAFDEWVADTSPTNEMSYLRILIGPRSPVPNEHQLSFGSSSNRRYWIDYRLDAPGAAWINARTNLSGAGGPQSITVTNPQPAVHYRLGVELP